MAIYWTRCTSLEECLVVGNLCIAQIHDNDLFINTNRWVFYPCYLILRCCTTPDVVIPQFPLHTMEAAVLEDRLMSQSSETFFIISSSGYADNLNTSNLPWWLCCFILVCRTTLFPEAKDAEGQSERRSWPLCCKPSRHGTSDLAKPAKATQRTTRKLSFELNYFMNKVTTNIDDGKEPSQ